eukprot:Anaeramoba_flamelloidesc34366_g1_i1.p1 GENE.c34366_g1_i1~~c34366_g1_i1.p1  ORF type:complete len:103 (+),score=19.14 c34366_g1_i1:1-309(+)
MEYFKKNPKPFFTLAKELIPSDLKPTPVHHFCKLLEKKKVLHRVYTQNIDTLERKANVLPEKLVEAHGSFAYATCLKCRCRYLQKEIQPIIMKGEVPKCKKM